MARAPDPSPALRAEVARYLPSKHIDQLATGYLGFTSDELDDIKHDKKTSLEVIMEVLRR